MKHLVFVCLIAVFGLSLMGTPGYANTADKSCDHCHCATASTHSMSCCIIDLPAQNPASEALSFVAICVPELRIVDRFSPRIEIEDFPRSPELRPPIFSLFPSIRLNC